MDPRARLVAVVISLLLAAGGGYAVAAATDDKTAATDVSLQAPRPDRKIAPIVRPESESGAADEYELDPRLGSGR